MGPQPSSRGNKPYSVPAEQLIRNASMGPQPSSRGNWEFGDGDIRKRHSFNGAATFQSRK